MSKLIRETSAAKTFYSEKDKLIEVIWDAKNISSEEYRDVFIQALNYAEDAPFELFLSDNTKQGVVSPADRKWFQNYAVKKGISLGLHKAAVVIENNPFKKYYINMILKVVSASGINMKIFTDYNKAKTWLLKNT